MMIIIIGGGIGGDVAAAMASRDYEFVERNFEHDGNGTHGR